MFLSSSDAIASFSSGQRSNWTWTEATVEAARHDAFLRISKVSKGCRCGPLMNLIDTAVIGLSILEDFFYLRYDFYDKRKNALFHELGKASLQLENKVGFIRVVVDGTLVVSNTKEAGLCTKLKAKGYRVW
ncbi:hypothetical protein L1987_07260 [Smallanthus sonchifolius]|uniref:Uncharacterized protein n=1 Tax=Smallanthus sonchifolius TaxID=185202 RepID=A0ACB9K0F8_9ASTR|nr:hypothetical protein L1987_07260 [Smallanthus sonchifolius]